MDNKVTLTCLNPRGKLDLPKPEGLTNPRVEDLKEKTIGIFWDGKMGGDNYCIAVERLLNERYPETKTIRAAWGDIDSSEKALKEVDAFIYSVGDSGIGGWVQCIEAIKIEKLGIPGVFVVAEVALQTAMLSAHDAGFPALRIVNLPSIDYFPNRQTSEGLRSVTEANFDAVITALTGPLTPEENNPGLYTEKEMPDKIEFTAYNYESLLTDFNRKYFDNHWGDGLPLIPPTEEAVKGMLAGTDFSPLKEIGLIPFRGGLATVEKIAVNAVMAGARPEYLPVIIATLKCMVGKDSGFTHMLSSEGSFTCVIMVGGPIGEEIKMNSGVGLLGHCQPANNTIGRAVRLCLINLGYLWPGEIDMALIGRPSSHTFYTFAENIPQSPWESYAEGLGYKPEESCVTVSTVGGATGMGMSIYGGGVVEPWNINEVLANIVDDVIKDRVIFGAYKLGVANPKAHLRKHIIVIHPELSILLKRNGFKSKNSLRDYIYEQSKIPYEEMSQKEIDGIYARINTKPGGMFFDNDAFSEKELPVIKESLKPGGRVPVVDPADIHIIIAGSIPGYSFGLSYFRSSHKTEKISGAALTKLGR